MGTEIKFSGTLDNVSQVIFTCRKCGNQVASFDPGNWKIGPLYCTSCGNWPDRMDPDSDEYQTINEIQYALFSAIKLKDSLPFKIGLEFATPDNSEPSEPREKE